VEVADLVLGELPDGALALMAEPHRTDRSPDEPRHRMVDRFEQPAHEVVATLVQDELDDRPPRRHIDDGERVDLDQPVLELHPLAQPAPQRPRDRPGHLGEVSLRHLERRMGQPVREVAVVGEEQQAFRLGVEPADVEQPL